MQATKKILVVVADSWHAQFYCAHGPQHLEELAYFEHPEGRLHESKLTTKEHDANTCPYKSNVKKDREILIFAKILAEHLAKYLRSENANEICVFAPGKFLDHVKRQKFDKHVKITGIVKDYIHEAPEPARLQEAMRTAGLSFIPNA